MSLAARHLPLEGVENFRDFGGYPATGGRRLRSGRLYRSAAHHKATDADLAVLAELDLAAVVDLRAPVERTASPSRRPHGFAGQVFVTKHDPVEGWAVFVRGNDLGPAAFRSFMIDYFRRAPFEPQHVEIFASYFRCLAEAEGPVLIHCTAGKDRTGILAALTHEVMGVHPDDALADFLLTNEAVRLETRVHMIKTLVEQAAGRPVDEEGARVMAGVEPAFLQAAFSAMCDEYGSAEAYLREALGVGPAEREALRARFLE